ncbi:MAG TPA: zinc ribbon domain-containing protein [Chthoniobacterales bacterium]|jgi:hypothetical protein
MATPPPLSHQPNRFCSQCGASADADAKFCSACGSPIQKAESATDEARKAAPAAIQKPKKKSGCLLAGVLVSCFILVLIIIGAIIGPSDSHKTSPSETASGTATPALASPGEDANANASSTPSEENASPVAATPTATQATPTPTPFKKRIVRLDLEGEKPDKTEQIALAVIRKIKWSLSGDAATAAREDAAQFLTVAAGMKTYPDVAAKNIVVVTASDSFDESPEIEKRLKASGMSEDKIEELISSEESDSPFANNPSNTYRDTFDSVVGKNYDEYWAKVIGESPQSSPHIFGGDDGIYAINEVLKKALNDPDSLKFDHFDAEADPIRRAWKIDYYFRAKNAFGAMIMDRYRFYMRNGEVIGVEHSSVR